MNLIRAAPKFLKVFLCFDYLHFTFLYFLRPLFLITGFLIFIISFALGCTKVLLVEEGLGKTSPLGAILAGEGIGIIG